ncbi:SdpI family protein [Tenacibaculum dicentrarchi]|uniref:SdpI family protein n=1 Tax=Tenacibaculum dicentrarchi TaxID=669041 RepID=UPI000C7B0DF2
MILLIGFIYIVLLIVSIIYNIKPPKKINGIYGYRTPYSIKNEENWIYCNKLASKYMLINTHVILLLLLFIYALYYFEYLSLNTVINFIWIIPCLCLVFMVCIIEIKIRKRNE